MNVNFDDWDNDIKQKHIYEIGITRDFDIVGYICATDIEEAREKSKKDNYLLELSKKHNLRFVKIKAFKATFVTKKLSLKETLKKIKMRRLREAIRASHNFESLQKSIKELENNNLN